MVDLKLFKTRSQPSATVRNEAGGMAYELSARQALAQYAATGCFGGTFYAGAEEQLDAVAQLAERVDVDFVSGDDLRTNPAKMKICQHTC